MRFDDTGKVSFDHIYTEPDPRAYFRTLRGLDYCIPQLAKPHFRALIEEYRSASGVATPQVVDIGSSYGINAALLRCDATMADLYARYGDAAPDTTDELLGRDRDLVAGRAGIRARFVGLDVSEPALAYATKAGFLDEGVFADLESNEPTADQRAQLLGTDLVISTGCLGYVGVPTISRVVTAAEGTPWMAHFVLRMFPFDSIADALAGFGYRTVLVDGSFRQRRFASAEEQEQVLDTLAGVGVDPSGWETDGWFYAQLYLCRPVVGSPGD
ncbi:MAG TPA: class I SAM-dependent methyltransferase [Pseudonocardiaceae bacterium]